MKFIYLFIVIISTFQISFGQKKNTTKSINDFNFESITNPAFLLLDETPTAISTPDNLRTLALYISNGLSNSNIAIEVNPYWFFEKSIDTSYRNFRGINNGKINPFKSFVTNSSISFGYIEKKIKGIDEAKKTVALGARFTLYESYGKRGEELEKIITSFESEYLNDDIEQFDGFVKSTPNPKKKDENYLPPSNDDCKDTKNKNKYDSVAIKFLNENRNTVMNYNKDKLLKEYFDDRCSKMKGYYYNKKNIKPVFRLDGAIGYSLLFKENNISTSTANRFGSWLTADFALDISKKKNIKFGDKNVNNYLHLLAIMKYVEDGFNIDENQKFSSTSFWDYGGKIEIEFNKLKFSYEYLERDGEGEQYRSVGNITYQFSKKMSITGGFGKDFPEDDNLVTILGINWGLDLGEKSFSK